MIKAGCRIAWSRVKVEGLPICDNSSLLEKYSYTYWEAVDMERNKLLEYTNCPMPCTFMEYEVRIVNSIHSSFIRAIIVLIVPLYSLITYFYSEHAMVNYKKTDMIKCILSICTYTDNDNMYYMS